MRLLDKRQGETSPIVHAVSVLIAILAVILVVWALKIALDKMIREALILKEKGRINQIVHAVNSHMDDEERCLFRQPKDNGPNSIAWKATVSKYLSHYYYPGNGQLPISEIFIAHPDRKHVMSNILAVECPNRDGELNSQRCEHNTLIICLEASDLHVGVSHSSIYQAEDFVALCEGLLAQNRQLTETYVIVGQVGERPYSTTLEDFLSWIKSKCLSASKRQTERKAARGRSPR